MRHPISKTVHVVGTSIASILKKQVTSNILVGDLVVGTAYGVHEMVRGNEIDGVLLVV